MSEAASADPTLVVQWGSAGAGDSQFNLPTDLAIGPDRSVYVADSNNNRIQKFSASGTFLTKWGLAGGADGRFRGATGVATDAAGNVYVTDFGNDRVQEFTADGTFIRKWGTQGSGDGQFRGPRGITVDRFGGVYVSEFAGDRVQKFTPDGQFITKWGTRGSGDGQFRNPFGLATDRSGDVFVVDTVNDRVQKFSSTGTFITKWGSTGTKDGQFRRPVDVTVAPDGNLLVADNNNRKIQRFTEAGVFLSTIDSLAPGSIKFRPSGIATDPAGDVYILDGGGSRVLEARGAATPLPVVGKTVNAEAASGDVFVSVPAGSAFASVSVPGIKGRTFVPLTDVRQLPVGSLLDTRKGTLSVTIASTKLGVVSSGSFSEGVFQALQSRSGLTDVTLKGSSFSVCSKPTGKRASAALSSRTIRRLHGSASGRFRSRGRYSAATVRGTEWDTIDRCDGTLTKVKRGTVVVRDFRKHRNITVHAGKSYLARAPG